MTRQIFILSGAALVLLAALLFAIQTGLIKSMDLKDHPFCQMIAPEDYTDVAESLRRVSSRTETGHALHLTLDIGVETADGDILVVDLGTQEALDEVTYIGPTKEALDLLITPDDLSDYTLLYPRIELHRPSEMLACLWESGEQVIELDGPAHWHLKLLRQPKPSDPEGGLASALELTLQ